MPREEHRGDIARLQPRREIGQLVDHGLAAQIGADDHLEPERLQRICDGFGVVDRLLQLPVGGEIRIEVVANRQRDPFLGRCGRRRSAEAGCEASNTQQGAQADACRSDEMPSEFHGLLAPRADRATLAETSFREHRRMRCTLLVKR